MDRNHDFDRAQSEKCPLAWILRFTTIGGKTRFKRTHNPDALEAAAMLVLSRKKGQKIHIGDGVVVTINQINGNRVRVGIQAPEEVAIRRSELIPITNPSESHNDHAVGVA